MTIDAQGRVVALECPHCGAPIAPSVASDVVVCAYCRRTLVGVPGASWGLALRAADDEALDPTIDPRRVHAIGGRRYVVAGRIAQGERSEIFLAERAGRVRELVILKVTSDAARADAEWRAVHALHESSAQGADFFSTLLPQPVARGKIAGRATLVYRWRSGFVHTLGDVRRAYPAGVDPRAAVWMWRRALELLGWVHASGASHGAIAPEHCLIHARDHGVVFCGWSSAMRGAPGDDVARAARAIAYALGGDATSLPASVPAKLAEIVRAYATGARTDDAWSAKERVREAAIACFGPPAYVPFEMRPQGERR